MPAVKICPLPDGGLGPLGGPFTVESADADPQGAVAATVVQFGRWISRGMSYYQNKGGIEDSSLFKSFTAECFEELSRDDPDSAACLTDLTVICSGSPAIRCGACTAPSCRRCRGFGSSSSRELRSVAAHTS
jgi:hypothetical protein